MNKRNIKKSIIPYLALALILMGIFYGFNVLNKKVNVFSYDEFMKNVNQGKVVEIAVTPRDRAQTYEIVGKLKDYKENESFFVRVPLSNEMMKKIMEASEIFEFKFVTHDDPESSSLLLILVNVVPILILVGGAFFLFTRQMGGANKSMDFGKSKAKLSSDKNKVTFNDVAGLKEEKEEVKELIDFLKSPKKFQKLVGVGARRGRDMFQQAKRNAPCLIFIDEIDAVGRQRGTGLGGGHDEREQTLNQLLTEMDGFGENEGIIIIAATNRPDVLDPALLRPGRFDRQVTVNLPDIKGREEILKVHARNKVLSKGVTLENLAKRTPGFSGADLENLLNEAALLAVRRNKEAITMSEIDEATDRVLMGPAKTSRKYSEEDRKIVSYHEAGHVVLGLKLNDANDVQKVTIIPRGPAGGYAMMVPKEERMNATKDDLLEEITGLLGGRVSEELIFNKITTGAQNDFEKATKIARAMVTEYGMSDLGPMQLEQQEGAAFLGRDYNKVRNFSNEVAHEIDLEMRKIIDNCYANARKILDENRDLLKLIADALLEYETLTKEQIEYLVENGHMEEEEENYERMSLTKLREIAKEKDIEDYDKLNKADLIKELNNK